MRPSLPPDMGDNAAAQATLEARLRREQVKRVSHVEDLANVTGNATDGQALVYSQAKGAWQPGAAGGFPSATAIVVAADAKNQAVYAAISAAYMFLCSGTNDDVTIQAAVTYTTTGLITMTDGTFNIGTASSGISGGSTKDIVGWSGGGTGTNIKVPTGMGAGISGNAILGFFNRVSDITITIAANASRQIFGVANGSIVTNVGIYGPGGANLAAGSAGVACSSGSFITNCFVNSMPIGVFIPGGTHQAMVEHNYLFTCSTGIAFDSASTTSGNIVLGNVTNNGSTGILLTSNSNDNLVTGNFCQTYSTVGIAVDGARNCVQSNVCRKFGASPANGMTVAATGSANMVTNNDLNLSGTASFADAGTGTVTAAGNRL